MPLVHLIDASPYLFRAFFSLPDTIVDTEGLPANAVKGFSTFLTRYLKLYEPSHVGVAFDCSLNTSFRNEFYPPYKAQRAAPPPELERQIDGCVDVARAMGLATYIDPLFEADDLIATLVGQLVPAGHSAVIVTSDKDLAQLVTGDVSLFDFAKEQRYGESEVFEKFGVHPSQIVDYLAIAGDTVDNIPGVRGLGSKTAVQLLAAFGSLETLYARLGEVSRTGIRGAASVEKKLRESRDDAFLSRRLASLSFDAPAIFSEEHLRCRGVVEELFAPLAKRYRLRS